MKKLTLIAVLCLLGLQVFAQDKTKDFTPDALAGLTNFSWICKQKEPFANLKAEKIDVRSCDLSNYDLTALPKETLEKLTFDDKTIWPKKMPKWLNIKKINKIGKTPGLNIKKLHKKGITGKGVNIAIIDQNLGPHQEYAENLVFYKNLGEPFPRGTMHGAAVASIAVGKNVGVAPDAKLYFIVADFKENETNKFDAEPIAYAIEYILELNEILPVEDRISIISISRGFGPEDLNRKYFLEILKQAKEKGVLVLTTNDVFTVSRNCYYASPDKIISYTKPAYWFEEEEMPFYEKISDICVPTEYRIIASPTGEKDYVAYANGGLSWAVPYLAGVATLAKQVKPDLTPDEFLEVAHKTAQSVEVKHQSGKSVKNNTFINPQALIKELQKNNKQ